MCCSVRFSIKTSLSLETSLLGLIDVDQSFLSLAVYLSSPFTTAGLGPLFPISHIFLDLVYSFHFAGGSSQVVFKCLHGR